VITVDTPFEELAKPLLKPIRMGSNDDSGTGSEQVHPRIGDKHLPSPPNSIGTSLERVPNTGGKTARKSTT
jgi:hypothetical protein